MYLPAALNNKAIAALFSAASGDLRQNRDGHFCHYSTGGQEAAWWSAPLIHVAYHELRLTPSGANFLLENCQGALPARDEKRLRNLAPIVPW